MGEYERRVAAVELVDQLFQEIGLNESMELTSKNREMDEEIDIYDILSDVSDDFTYNHKELLARILFLEDGEYNGCFTNRKNR